MNGWDLKADHTRAFSQRVSDDWLGGLKPTLQISARTLALPCHSLTCLLSDQHAGSGPPTGATPPPPLPAPEGKPGDGTPGPPIL